MRILKKALILLALIFVVFSFLLFVWLRSTLPKTHGILKSDKILSKVEIERNRWGVPFIRAEKLEDMFFAIGFVHAQDRLYQMELSRRMAQGRLSEIFGKTTLDSDIAQKTALVEESLERTMDKINPRIKKFIEHYSAGINYFIDTQTLPIEFKVLNYRPEKWSVKDSLSILKIMENILCGSGSELYNYILINAIGFERARKLIHGNYGTSIIKKDEYESLNGEILDDKFIPKKEEGIGSNSWVVSGRITDTGFPYLANDPHLGLMFPSYFYQIYAEIPDLELCGNTLPGAPFIVIGRNKNIGWGFTNVESDVIDYYILKVNLENENKYFWNGEWKDFKISKKVVKVKGGEEKQVEVKLTEFGRVWKFKDLYLLIQSVTDHPSKTIESIFEMNLSKNFEEFLSALKKFSAPAQNVVFADRDGDIGYFPAGLIPVRSKGDGSLPVPAQSDSDLWKGFWDEDKKPYLLNPERGFIVTANNPVLPEGEIPIFSMGWVSTFRAERIEDLIKGKSKLSLEDMKDIQTDTFHKGAEFLINKIRNMNFKSEKSNFVIENFKNWDFKLDKGFSPYLFYNFEYFLARNIFEDNFKDENESSLISTNWTYKIMNYPNGNEDQDFFYWIDDLRTDKKERFEEIIEKSLENTFDKFKEEYKGRNKIDWEEIHLIYYKHPFGSIPILKYFFNRGPFFMRGGRGCVQTASFIRGKDFKVTTSSAFRMIIDFSDFSKSIIINSSGESGNPLSRNYDDQIKLYLSGEYRKMEEKTEGKKILIITP